MASTEFPPTFPKSTPIIEAMSPKLPDSLVPAEYSGASNILEVYSFGVFNATTTPNTAKTRTEMPNDFLSASICLAKPIKSISLVLETSLLFSIYIFFICSIFHWPCCQSKDNIDTDAPRSSPHSLPPYLARCLLFPICLLWHIRI